MIIGLTGKNASGKGEVADYLVKKGFSYFSLSDIIREEAKKQGVEENRENLIKTGNELRRKYGAGILARLTNKKLNDNSVVDSIRNPEEIKELRKNKDFILIGIDAPVELRFKRALERGRIENAKTLSEFKAMEEKENLKNPVNQQLDECLGMADKTLLNDGSIEELHKKMDVILEG
ncbi:AAA family ATPase [Candidatus Woesearchaeota archaeon]|nr:AAA family ATPase [Candidatus Woesearchaeota archaeon]